ncbi:MAG: hypothetical protein IKZ82_00985 [Clostridia bacterium]|nr:hypothetical protein [Clostridia bacterium]
MEKVWKSNDILELLQRIDEGHEPTAEERSALESCVELVTTSFGADNIPGSIGWLSALGFLNLSGSKLTKLPETIGQLGALEYLDLSFTMLTELPETIGQLGALKYLDLRGTKLTELPETIGQLGALNQLHLGGTKLTELPETIGRLGALKHLDLSRTKLTELPEKIGQLGKLEKLYLDGTALTELPETIGQLNMLETLVLRFTKMTELPESIGRLIALKRLSLSGTKLTELPEMIERLSNLKALDLSGLKLKRIPQSLAELGLPFVDEVILSSGINLHNTILEEQNISIFLKSPELIPSLYNENELTEVRECKVIFIGDGGSGKTHTIERIKNRGEKKDYKTKVTHGVKISDYKPDDRDFTINFWDFGGQEIQHSMHRCFLTEDTCYVVTVRTRESAGDKGAEFWLRNVEAFAPNAPVLLFINCWDNKDGRRFVNETELRAFFPNIVDIVYCSALDTEAEEFNKNVTESMVRMVEASGYCKKEVSRRWMKTAEDIRRENTKCITKEQYRKICNDNGIEENEYSALLTFFNNLGVCLSYHKDENNKELEQYMVLDPVWITNALYAVIEEGGDHSDNGMILNSSIASMLENDGSKKLKGEEYERTAPELKYEPDECPYIISVAASRDLCYIVDDKTTFFPVLCDPNSPKAALGNFDTYQERAEYVFKYEYLPDSVVHKLMVRCYRREMKVIACWRKGMVLGVLGELKAVIRMENDDKTLRINFYSTPTRPACELFPYIRDEILAINRELNLSAEESIIKGEDEFFAARLVKAYRNKKKTVEGSRTGEEYDPFELLASVFDIFSIVCLEERDGKLKDIQRGRFHKQDKEDKAFRQALWEAHGKECSYCGVPLHRLYDMQVDHILPTKFAKQLKNADGRARRYINRLEAKGFDLEAPDYIENFLPSCVHCNQSMQNRIMTADSMCFYHEKAVRKTPYVLERMDKLKCDKKKGREELKKH